MFGKINLSQEEGFKKRWKAIATYETGIDENNKDVKEKMALQKKGLNTDFINF